MQPTDPKTAQFVVLQTLETPAELGITAALRGAVLLAHHSLHFRVHTRVFVTLVIALAATAVLWAEPSYRSLMREAGEAQKAGNVPQLIEKLEAIRAQRPDYPRALTVLARAYATAGQQDPKQLDRAIATLASLAARGLAGDPAKDAALAPLATHPEFARLAAQMAGNAAPRGHLTVAQTLPAQTGIIESAVVDARGRWFFGDVRQRCIWVRAADGTLARFSGENDGLLGVFGLAVDEARGALWAGVSAVDVTQNFNAANEKGWGYLAEYDLATGKFRRSFQIPRPGGQHVLGTVRLGPDGAVYASDSSTPVIWRLAPGANELEAWLEHPDFLSLQGVAFSADGRTLYVADYANGVWAVDVATKQPALLRPTDDTTLFGIDDLHFHQGALIGVQNGIAPLRVIRITLAGGSARAESLAQGHEAMNDAATGSVVGGDFLFVGNAGWSLYERAQSAPAARDVHLVSLRL
jgi:sugar lactone lactonase YvrE